MANVIQSLTVGLGFEVDKKSVSNVESSFDGVASKAKQLGLAIGSAVGVKGLTIGYSAWADELGKFADANDLTASDVNAFGKALEHNGGSVQAFMGSLAALTKTKADFIATGGGADIFGELAMVGVDMGRVFDAGNAIEQYKELTQIIHGLEPALQKAAVSKLGLSQADLLTFKGGVGALEVEANYQKTLRDISNKDAENAAKFNGSVQDLMTSIGGLTDVISKDLVGPLSEGIKLLTGEVVDLKSGKTYDEAMDVEVAGGETVGDIIGLLTASILAPFSKEAQYALRANTSSASLSNEFSPVKKASAKAASKSAGGKPRILQPVIIKIGNETIADIVHDVNTGQQDQALTELTSSVE